MPDELPFTADERRLLESLLRHRIRFMIVGLSVAALQGAPVVTQDVALWFEDLSDVRMHRAVREAGATYVAPFELRPPMLVGAGAELFDLVTQMDGLGPFEEEWHNTIELPLGRHRLKGLLLERVLASKQAANRPKDRLVIPVLRDTLASITHCQPRPRQRRTRPRS